MKKLGLLLLLVVIALMLGETASAQDYSIYFTTYYSNANTANAPDATVRIINDGNNGDLYANIYVFNDSEELQECCSCEITPDGIVSESVNKNLTANPLTGITPTRGVIKVITNNVQGAAVGIPPPLGGLHGSATHVQKLVTGFTVTEAEIADSNLAPSEQTLLYTLCYADWLLSGQPCTCQPEDYDF